MQAARVLRIEFVREESCMKRLVIMGIALSAVAAQAQTPPRPSAACGSEIVKMCGFTGGVAGISACVRKRYKELSKSCQQELAAMRPKPAGKS
jgi:hypothetical protein